MSQLTPLTRALPFAMAGCALLALSPDSLAYNTYTGTLNSSSYYSEEEYKQEIKRNAIQASFRTGQKPSGAALVLQPFPRNSQPMWRTASDNTSVRVLAQASGELNLDWEAIRKVAKPGDLLFLRRQGDPYSPLGTFTHVALIYDVVQGKIFECVPDANPEANVGVHISDYASSSTFRNAGRHLTAWSLKRITPQGAITEEAVRQQMIDSARTLNGSYHWPKIAKAYSSVREAIKPFFDTDRNTSMSASKLVWRTFRPLVDLDSHRSQTRIPEWRETPGTGLGEMMGVSPDDLYYSDKLAPDLLQRSLDDWAQALD